MSKKIMPPTYLLFSIIFMVLLHFVLPAPIVFAAPWNVAGILFMIAGVMININADNTFRIMGTTVKPFAESTHLVTSGFYRFSRNPMYFGFALILAGLAILLDSLAPFAVLLLFAILMDREFITVEERMLAAKFNAEWHDYKNRVRRWI